MRTYTLLIPIIFCLLIFSCTKKTSTVSPQQKTQDSTAPPVTPQPKKYLVDTLAGTYKGMSIDHMWGGTTGGASWNNKDTIINDVIVIMKVDSATAHITRPIYNQYRSHPDTIIVKISPDTITLDGRFWPKSATLTYMQDSVMLYIPNYGRSSFSEYRFSGEK